MQLFSNKSTDGASSPYIKGGKRSRGTMNIYLHGDFGGGTVHLEAKAPNGLYVPISGASFTEEGMHTMESGPAVIRANLSGSTGASVSVWVEEDSVDTWYEIQNR